MKSYPLKTSEQILRSLKRLFKEELGVGTYISIEKRYDQEQGWKLQIYKVE